MRRIRIRPETSIQDLRCAPGTDARKRDLRQPGLRCCKLAGVPIKLRQGAGNSRPQTGAVRHQGRELAPLFQNRAPPTPTPLAPLRLKTPLEEMQHQGHQSTFQLAPVSFPQGFYFLRNVLPVNVVPLLPADQRSRGLCPAIKVFVVMRRVTHNLFPQLGAQNAYRSDTFNPWPRRWAFVTARSSFRGSRLPSRQTTRPSPLAVSMVPWSV